MSVAGGGCEHRRLATLRADLALDLRRYREASATGGGSRGRLALFLTPQLAATLVHRLSHFLHAAGWIAPAHWLARINLVVYKVAISPASCIGGGLYLPRPVGVTFHGRAGGDLTLYSQSVCSSFGPSLAGRPEDGPRLGQRVSIGVHAAVLGRVSVGDGTKVAFRVILARDAPPNRIVASRSMRHRARPRREGAPC